MVYERKINKLCTDRGPSNSNLAIFVCSSDVCWNMNMVSKMMMTTKNSELMSYIGQFSFEEHTLPPFLNVCFFISFFCKHSFLKLFIWHRFASEVVQILLRVGLKSSMTANGDPFVLMDGA